MSGSASIVGAGIFGASLAYRLARDGWDVTLYERHEPGHPGAASGGDSRLIRYAHGADAWYTRSAWRARELWRELEAETGRELLVECGVAWLAHAEDGWEATSESVLEAEGIPVERLGPEAGLELFPSFDPAGLAFVLWEPKAGVLRAREATKATAEAAERAGARIVRETVRRGGPQADIVVWAAGAWLPELFDLEIRVTKQDTLYFGAAGWATPPLPAWVDYDRAIYGHGDLDALGVKVAPDREGPEFDPETGRREVSPDTEAAARAYLAERFPDARRRAARPRHRLPVRADDGHELPDRAASGARGRVDPRRRLGPRLQARARAGGVRGADRDRRGAAERAVRARPARTRTEPPNRRD